LWGQAALAHRSPDRYQVVVQRDEAGLALLWTIEQHGYKAQLVAATFDLDKDGALGPAESAAAAVRMAQAALALHTLRWNGAPLPEPRVEGTVVKAGRDTVTATCLVAYGVQGAGTLSVRRDGPGAVRVATQALAPWVGQLAPVQLLQGHETSVAFHTLVPAADP
jgi:hypothetical protein